MPWLRIDDGFDEHPKIVGLSDKAFRLHVYALCYCARNLTDGVLIPAQLAVLRRKIGGRYAYIQELIDAGLWAESDEGLMIHDYLDYNPNAAEVKASRVANAERQARHRRRSNAVTNAVTPRKVTPLVTGPRPDPKEEVLEEETVIPRGVTHPLTEMLRHAMEDE